MQPPDLLSKVDTRAGRSAKRQPRERKSPPPPPPRSEVTSTQSSPGIETGLNPPVLPQKLRSASSELESGPNSPRIQKSRSLRDRAAGASVNFSAASASSYDLCIAFRQANFETVGLPIVRTIVEKFGRDNVLQFPSASAKKIFLLVRASQPHLQAEAEDMGFKLLLDEKELLSLQAKGLAAQNPNISEEERERLFNTTVLYLVHKVRSFGRTSSDCPLFGTAVQKCNNYIHFAFLSS